MDEKVNYELERNSISADCVFWVSSSVQSFNFYREEQAQQNCNNNGCITCIIPDNGIPDVPGRIAEFFLSILCFYNYFLSSAIKSDSHSFSYS